MERIEAITAVHHPVRRRIYDYLSLHGTAQVTTLARALGLQVGSVSHHLRMLKRAGVVEHAPDTTGDRRTSWWQTSRSGLTWSAEDFTDSPADALLAREAERANVETHVGRLRAWHRRTAPLPEWARAAFSIDTLAWATPDELEALSAAMRETFAAWQAGIDESDAEADADAERRPVFVFAHGFPTVP
ncbi:winged helix-turn-helix domain-containing protein [Krasilnikoviella flava]|uniref:Helix-turn-helix domain-containing protein n=1 Tax=Krasilnikoviella flava TaxID=526729 RepID=A0A1T5K5M3_9MICO|nr:helix-turn-helix domain-containing protein [Krasilnikoviella flava]SKC58921.1 Helix-turn-helix domain-containing protein [Krasilnikoviella flava]